VADAGDLVGEGGRGGRDRRVPRDSAGIRRLFPGRPSCAILWNVLFGPILGTAGVAGAVVAVVGGRSASICSPRWSSSSRRD